MVRLGVSVEGPTEERFIKTNLASYLAEKQVFITPISIGGNLSVDKVKSELKKLVYNFDCITTFYDFYGFKRKAEGETKESLEKKISLVLNEPARDRFIPYIQMYEFEGLLFSSPEAIGSILQDDGLIGWAEGILQAANYNPESINDSTITAPSKRLEGRTTYRKITHGPNIANQIGLPKLREMCPGFNQWLTQIENLEDVVA